MIDKPNAELLPNEIVRKVDGPKYFGLQRTQLDAEIKAGRIPRPISLTLGGRARGWLGAQIIEHQRLLRERAEASDTAVAAEKPPAQNPAPRAKGDVKDE